MRDERIVVIVAVLAIVGLVALVAWLVARVRMRRTDRQGELQGRMLDKFASAEELSAFLQTEGGQRFLEAAPSSQDARSRILNSIQRGTILTLVGLALFPAGDGKQPALFFGSILTAGGLGFLISAGVAWWLSKKWGMINGEGK